MRDLPALNAALNASCACLLLLGYWLIRHGRREAHRRTMLAALATSALFLASYLTYHFQVGSVRFTGQGLIRRLYFAVLISHTINNRPDKKRIQKPDCRGQDLNLHEVAPTSS